MQVFGLVVLDEELLELVGLAVQLVGAAIAHMMLGASWQGDMQELSPFWILHTACLQKHRVTQACGFNILKTIKKQA